MDGARSFQQPRLSPGTQAGHLRKGYVEVLTMLTFQRTIDFKVLCPDKNLFEKRCTFLKLISQGPLKAEKFEQKS